MATLTLVPVDCAPGSITNARPTVCGPGIGSIVPTVCFVAPPVTDVDLFVTKTYVGPTPLLVGQDGNFRFVVGNNGPAAAVNAVVTDTVNLPQLG